MLSNFKLRKKDRQDAKQPKDASIWIKHGISEFLGTIFLSFALAGLSIVIGVDSNGGLDVLEFFFLHPVIVGFYAGFIVVGGVLVVCLRWSCDLNPAVTIYRLITGTNTYRYAFYKMAIQFVAAIITGLIIYGFGSINASAAHPAANVAIDALEASNNTFTHTIGRDSIAGGTAWIFLIELLMTSILLFPIFSPSVNAKYRDLTICMVISLVVFIGLLSKTAAINPARGLAQQVPGLFFGPEVGASSSWASLLGGTFGMFFGGMLAPFVYVFMRGVSDRYINPVFVKMIEYKNNRFDNLK